MKFGIAKAFKKLSAPDLEEHLNQNSKTYLN
jgi:hypothetical protein